MADPFLVAHHAAPRVFDISGKLSPVSVRDQMIRGQLFAQRAEAAGEITSKPGEGLLILGAGAGGVAAGITAASLGVPTTVLEPSPYPFRTQTRCSTRWIDPTQYDWPLDHWVAGQFPLTGLPPPLPWRSGFATHAAAFWQTALQSFLIGGGSPLLDLKLATTFINCQCPAGASNIQATYFAQNTLQTHSYGAVLVAVGFGTENIQVGPTYRGFAFWESDLFSAPNWGMPGSAAPRIVISGAGDGALQDLLRIMTRLDSAKDVLDGSGVSAGAAMQLKDLDRAAHGAMAWGAGPQHDHAWHAFLDTECRRLVRFELQQSAVRQKLATMLRHMPQHIELIHSCTHLTPLYVLNRFLAWLIAEYLKEEKGVSLLVARTRLTSVASATSGHICTLSPAACHGRAHEIELETARDCRNSTLPSSTRKAIKDVIVVRHGITAPAQAIQNLTPAVRPRQILPPFIL